ncbi:hypothetical protein [Mesorhizobium sp. B2-3-5]|uniref:hypothetical protein n=1 Tax=unclassified Mesorhizobium TaxID=325217 RepID=UPI0032B2066E
MKRTTYCAARPAEKASHRHLSVKPEQKRLAGVYRVKGILVFGEFKMKIMILGALALCLAAPAVASAQDAVVINRYHHHHRANVVINEDGQRLHHRHHGQIAFYDHGRRHYRHDNVVVTASVSHRHHRHHHVVIENGGY